MLHDITAPFHFGRDPSLYVSEVQSVTINSFALKYCLHRSFANNISKHITANYVETNLNAADMTAPRCPSIRKFTVFRVPPLTPKLLCQNATRVSMHQIWAQAISGYSRYDLRFNVEKILLSFVSGVFNGRFYLLIENGIKHNNLHN